VSILCPNCNHQYIATCPHCNSTNIHNCIANEIRIYSCLDITGKILELFAAKELAEKSWLLTYSKTKKTIYFDYSTHSLELKQSLRIKDFIDCRVLVDGICEGVIMETIVYSTSQHL